MIEGMVSKDHSSEHCSHGTHREHRPRTEKHPHSNRSYDTQSGTEKNRHSTRHGSSEKQSSPLSFSGKFKDPFEKTFMTLPAPARSSSRQQDYQIAPAALDRDSPRKYSSSSNMKSEAESSSRKYSSPFNMKSEHDNSLRKYSSPFNMKSAPDHVVPSFIKTTRDRDMASPQTKYDTLPPQEKAE